MKDVKTIADELGVSQQTIYRRIKDLDAKHIIKKGGKTYISPTGEAILKGKPIITPQNEPTAPDYADLYEPSSTLRRRFGHSPRLCGSIH